MYAQGHNRLFFQSQEEEQQDISITILNPSLKTYGKWPMTFVEDGLYYIDIWFRHLGSYVFSVFEDGKRVHRDILVVSQNEHIVYPEMNRLV